jgi:hypothetical protein
MDRAWVLDALAAPEIVEPDPSPGRTRIFRRIEAFGGRWLRVVYEDVGEERRIVTCFFDRKAGSKR